MYYNRFRYYSPDEGMYISQDPIGLKSGEPNFYSYVYDPNNWIDIFGLQQKIGGFVFRADDFYTGGNVGLPLGSDADIMTPWEHARRPSNGETSIFTSLGEDKSKLKKFTKKNKYSKISIEDLKSLEAEGKIKIYTPEDVRDMMKNSGNKKLVKDANNVYDIMNKNKEILVE